MPPPPPDLQNALPPAEAVVLLHGAGQTAKRLTRSIPGTALEIIDGARHAANTEQPSALAALITRAARAAR